MKIVDVEPILVARGWVVVKITADAGLVGWGECLGDKASTVAAAVHELSRYLIGQDPLRIEHHWQAMYRGAFWRGGPILNAAISGVDIALWDILGKSLGQPIWRTMGGNCREKIRLYMSPGGSTPPSIWQIAPHLLSNVDSQRSNGARPRPFPFRC